jgi:hypothetical protein
LLRKVRDFRNLELAGPKPGGLGALLLFHIRTLRGFPTAESPNLGLLSIPLHPSYTSCYLRIFLNQILDHLDFGCYLLLCDQISTSFLYFLNFRNFYEYLISIKFRMLILPSFWPLLLQLSYSSLECMYIPPLLSSKTRRPSSQQPVDRPSVRERLLDGV